MKIWPSLLISAGLLASAEGQTVTPAYTPSQPMKSRSVARKTHASQALTNGAPRIYTLRDNQVDSGVPTSTQLVAQISGVFVGKVPYRGIEFTLSVQNNGPTPISIVNPLEFLQLGFTTKSNAWISIPIRPSKSLTKTRDPMPYSAPIIFRRFLRGSLPSFQDQDTIALSAGEQILIAFETEPVVIDKVMEALRNEAFEKAKSFKVRAITALSPTSPTETRGRTVESDWITFELPAFY